MPNPVLIHTESSKVRHFLAIADFYIQIGQPDIYEVEPYITDEYRPDVYARISEPVIIEIQRSHVSHKRMQEKVDQFVETYRAGKHDAKTLWIVSDEQYRVKCPDGFKVETHQLKEGVI